LVPCWLQLFVSAERVLTSWFGEPRPLTCSRARPQPVVWMAPACARFLRTDAVLSGHVPSPWFDEPRQARSVLRAAAVLPGHVLSPWFGEPRCLRVFCARLRAPRARPRPLVRRAPTRASCFPGASSNPGRQLLLSCLSVPTRSSAVDALVGP
jgi:hypothetical protein